MSNENLHVAPKPMTPGNIAMIVAGSALYAVSVNLFLKPLALYAGGVVGLSQLINTLFLPDIPNFDTAGLINFLLNVPLFLLAWKTMSRKMLVGTMISLVVQTLVFSFVPILETPLLDDKLACIIIAGLLGGVGCGIVLTNGGSAGGLDLLGVFMAQHFPGFSVGVMNLSFNAVLYTVCAILYTIDTAIYSTIFIACFSIAIDRFHYQNIEQELMIFTHHPEIADIIMKKYVRGVTEWDGEGAYTGKSTHVLVTVVSKYETAEIKKDVLMIDPDAFIIVHDGTEVTGGYQKRLA